MTETAAQLLATFETLPSHKEIKVVSVADVPGGRGAGAPDEPPTAAQEKHELLTETLRRSGELPETFLSDDNYVKLADELFQILDAEESNVAQSGTE